jgi:hypothetical protein
MELRQLRHVVAVAESGLRVAFVTMQMARLFPKRVQLIALSSAPVPLCIATGHRTNRADDKPLAVFMEELRKAARTLA